MMKLLLLRRNLLTVAACLLVAAGMFYVVNHPAIVGASATTRQLPIYCVQRDQQVVSISFDAAWGNEDTQALIDILAKYKVRATFFVVGEWVDKYPESVKALSDAGHEVMNHSNDHAHMSQLSREEIVADVEACNDKIEAVTGTRPTLIRPPYGEYDDNVITSIRSIGMEPIQWDVERSHIKEREWGHGVDGCSSPRQWDPVRVERRPLVSPLSPVSSPRLGHRLPVGGTPMEIKHIHPTYEDPQERQERLLAVKRACAVLLGKPKVRPQGA